MKAVGRVRSARKFSPDPTFIIFAYYFPGVFKYDILNLLLTNCSESILILSHPLGF